MKHKLDVTINELRLKSIRKNSETHQYMER